VHWVDNDETKKRQRDEWAQQTEGDIIIGDVGNDSIGVAIGKDIRQTVHHLSDASILDDKQFIEHAISQLISTLPEMTSQSESSLRTTAEFQLQLLQGELAKTNRDDVPSANAIIRVCEWLLTNVPPIARPLLSLLVASATARVIAKAGAAAVQWVNEHVTTYVVETEQVDPIRLRQILTKHFNEQELRDLCFDLNIHYEDLYGESRSDKARELISYCVRHSRIHELEAMCRRLRPHAF
jgi:hypothetical protein